MKQKLFLISDTHFFHSNIIKYCNRPFQDVYAMNDYIVSNWNDKVTNDDYVLHLGDVSFGSKDNLFEATKKLNGHKILLKGNHDKATNITYQTSGFEKIFKEAIFISDLDIVFSHEPFMVDYRTQFKNIHGHIHDKNINDGRHFNVSVENIMYTPVEVFDDKMAKTIIDFCIGG